MATNGDQRRRPGRGQPDSRPPTSRPVPELTLAQHHTLAQEAFAHYFEHAAQLYSSFQRNLAHGSLAIAAFELHQVAETISKAVLVVFTAYLPKMHELGRR